MESLSDFAGAGYKIGEMHAKSDTELLRDYAERGAENAFAEIVHRHTNLVYSVALRLVNLPETAAEVAQTVFVSLAQGARSLWPRLRPDASLAGWLCRSARNVSLNLQRNEFRRRAREKLAMEQLDPTSGTDPEWDRLRPVVDEIMSELPEPDYDALVLRFFREQDFVSVGRALGVSDDAAQKRVSRALDKMRDLLSQRGITMTAAALAILLTANAVQTAPVGLAATISSAATLTATTVATTATAIKGLHHDYTAKNPHRHDDRRRGGDSDGNAIPRAGEIARGKPIVAPAGGPIDAARCRERASLQTHRRGAAEQAAAQPAVA